MTENLERWITKVVDFYKELFNYQLDYRYLFILLGITTLVLLLELYVVGWKKSSIHQLRHPNKSNYTDIISWFIEAFGFFRILSIVFSFGLCYYLVGKLQKSLPFDIIFEIKNAYLLFFVLYIIGDLKNYVRHLVFHKTRALWPIHAFHHSATELIVLTRQRGHFLEEEISRFFNVLPSILLGAPIETYFLVYIANELHQQIIHSAMDADWGWIGKYILVSPAAHRVHHSSESKHFDKNFGSTFIFWDRLFKTYHPPEAITKMGVPVLKFNEKGYIRDVLMVYKESFKELVNSIFKKRTSKST